MPAHPGRDPRPRPEEYPLDRVAEQYVKAADYFRAALEAHGKDVAAADVHGCLLIVARQTRQGGGEYERLRAFCERESIARIQRGPQE